MRIIVEPHICKIDKTPVNEKEINITKCEFEFANEITNDYVKEAYFTYGNNTYKQIITNNECDIPNEVLQQKGSVELGVVAFLVEGTTQIKRYNPSPCYFDSWKGSLKNAENTEPITPTDKEQMEQALQDGLNDIATAVSNAENLDVDVSKQDNTTTVTITKQNGTTKSEDILDGIGLDYNWRGTELGVKREDGLSYDYVNLQGPKGEPGAIRLLIVNQLPQTGRDDTLYFVPKQDTETSDLYDEYMWVNNTWELLGTKQITIDLSDYYTKEETYSQAQVNALIPDLTNYVKNTDYASYSTGGVVKLNSSLGVYTTNGFLVGTTRTNAQYTSDNASLIISKGTLENVLNATIGDISSAIDLINGESV